MTVATSPHIRKITLKLEQPNLEISQNHLQIRLRLTNSVETGFDHAVQPFVGFVRGRELDHQVTHVCQSSQCLSLAGQIEVRLHYLSVIERYELLMLFLVVSDLGQSEGFKR